MSRIAFCADVHLHNFGRYGGETVGGLNERCRMVVDVFERSVHAAGKHKCKAIVVCGDLFESDKPPPQLIAEVQRICSIARDSYRMKVVLLVGNHDQYTTAPGDHALAPLKDHAIVVDQPKLLDIGGDSVLMCLPFNPEPVSSWLASTVAALRAKTDNVWPVVAAAHFGLSDHTTAPFLVGARDSVDVSEAIKVVRDHKLRGIVVGNWHEHKSWMERDCFAWQCGALCPVGWKDPGLNDYGIVMFYDTVTNAISQTEIEGPRFVKLMTRDKIHAAAKEAKERKHTLFVQALVANEELEEVRALVMSDKAIHASEVLSDGLEAKSAAQEAARETRKAETAEQAVAAFVQSMHLEDGVKRERVHERVRGYLK